MTSSWVRPRWISRPFCQVWSIVPSHQFSCFLPEVHNSTHIWLDYKCTWKRGCNVFWYRLCTLLNLIIQNSFCVMCCERRYVNQSRRLGRRFQTPSIFHQRSPFLPMFHHFLHFGGIVRIWIMEEVVNASCRSSSPGGRNSTFFHAFVVLKKNCKRKERKILVVMFFPYILSPRITLLHTLLAQIISSLHSKKICRSKKFYWFCI